MGLRAQLLASVLQDLPTPKSELGEPSPRWDELLGGRIGKDDWARYGRTHGTTCIVFTNGEAISAGFPEDMIVTGATPGGAGTKILQAQHAGAKARGWARTPQWGVLPDLRPGDIYEINHQRDDGVDGTHEGIIVKATRSADGRSLTVETADGGQGSWTDQKATRQIRTFTLADSGAHPVLVKSQYSSGWLQSWIAVGGDADDPGVEGPGTGAGADPAAEGDADNSGLVAGALLTGVACLLFALALNAKTPPSPPRVNALRVAEPAVLAQRFRWRQRIAEAA